MRPITSALYMYTALILLVQRQRVILSPPTCDYQLGVLSPTFRISGYASTVLASAAVAPASTSAVTAFASAVVLGPEPLHPDSVKN